MYWPLAQPSRHLHGDIRQADQVEFDNFFYQRKIRPSKSQWASLLGIAKNENGTSLWRTDILDEISGNIVFNTDRG